MCVCVCMSLRLDIQAQRLVSSDDQQAKQSTRFVYFLNVARTVGIVLSAVRVLCYCRWFGGFLFHKETFRFVLKRVDQFLNRHRYVRIPLGSLAARVLSVKTHTKSNSP